MMRFPALLILILLYTPFCYGQQIVHFNITQQQGLPSNTVYDVFQDTQGFLWVATENGLARYNGASFLKYNNNEVRSTAVSNLFEGNDGRIWLNNFYGEILFVKNDTLRKLHSWENRYTEGFPIITNLGDSLLVNSTQKLYYFAIKSQEWLPQQTDTIQYFNHHTVASDGTQWLCYASNEYTYVTTLNKKLSHHYKLSNTQYKLNTNLIRLIAWQNKLWLFDLFNKQLYELNDGSIHNISALCQPYLVNVRQIKNLGDSLLAFIGYDGAHILNKQNQHQHLLQGKNVSSFTIDRENGIWIGTLNEGLYYLPSSHTIIYPKETFGLYTKIAVDKRHNQIIAGGYTGKTDVFSHNRKWTNVLLEETDKEVQAIFVDSTTNNLFIFTDILRIYNFSSGWKLINELRIPSVKHIAHVNNYLAMATSGGLKLFNIQTGQKFDLFNQQRITTIAYDAYRDVIWTATQKGLYQYHPSTQQYYQWHADSTTVSPGASQLMQLENGTIVVGTFTNGIYLIARNNEIIKYNLQNGLPSDRVTSITSNANNLWIGTDKGIAQLDVQTGKITIINNTQGLAAEEVYDLAWFKNQLWVSHAAGLQVISPENSINKQQPVIHLLNASSNHELIKNAYNEIILKPFSQQITFQFDVSNSLKSRGTTKIQYRIKELNNGLWNTTTLANPTANFMALPYGNYTFEAKAINEDGIESANILRIPLIILAPYWEQSWFHITLFLLALCILGLLIFFRINKSAKESKLRLQQINQQQELRIARLTSIRAQMNPHFIFNTMSLIQGNILNNLKDDATRTIHNFSTLIRKVLDFSGREMITLQEEIEVLEKYLSIEKDRFDGTLEFMISLNDDARYEMIRIPSLITQPFVENALRHGLMHKEGSKKLKISFILMENYLQIKIDDNGIGRKASSEFNQTRKTGHTSFAMNASQKRIDLINASRKGKITLEIIDKKNEYGLASGTTVQITIPMIDEHSG